MNSRQQPGKRIVTKRQYIVNVGTKASHILCIVVLAFISALCILTALASLAACLILLSKGKGWQACAFFGLVLFFGEICWWFIRSAEHGLKFTQKIKTGVPLTRANLNKLPATGILVRPSEESVHEPESVLLRAASQGKETPIEQLVLPADGLERIM